VSFLQGSTDFNPTVSEFTDQMPRLAGLWSDLNPSIGGVITSTDTSAGVLTVLFSNVPQYGQASHTNTFELEFDTLAGSCAILNYTPHPSHGSTSLVGISPGGFAPGTAVIWSSLAGLGQQTGAPVRALHERVSGGAPTGFTSITFPAGNASAYTVN
jgi:hypothetical protein